MEAKGAVTGQIQLFEPKTISTGWQYVNGKVWKNHQHDKAVVNLSLEKADKNRKNLKVVMNHGNSWPINLDKISAYYSAPALLFLAHNSGTYEVYGGNDEAAIAQYDMSIAREKLMSLIPESIKMDIVEPIGARGWYQEWLAILIKTRWGLYIVLGSLSLLVMNLIKRLFPKA
ncbi:MAG: hypothetical protein GY874_21415 [Desulfobacteraceae bacterium]|nr:hypothetical protein [Desulfobacteraceae bacterium]